MTKFVGISIMQPILRHARLFALTIGILLLAFAVFNWGLQYKMSLYQTSTNAAQAPAKLWTGKTVAPSTTLAWQFQAAPALFLAIWLVLLRWASSLTLVPISSNLAIPWKQRIRIALTAFSFRPPPAAA